jgi:hypothetical protein
MLNVIMLSLAAPYIACVNTVNYNRKKIIIKATVVTIVIYDCSPFIEQATVLRTYLMFQKV